MSKTQKAAEKEDSQNSAHSSQVIADAVGNVASDSDDDVPAGQPSQIVPATPNVPSSAGHTAAVAMVIGSAAGVIANMKGFQL